MFIKRTGKLCSRAGATAKEQHWSWNPRGATAQLNKGNPTVHSPSHWRQRLNERLLAFHFKILNDSSLSKSCKLAQMFRLELPCSPHSVPKLASQPQMRSEAVLVTDWETLFQCCCLSSDVFLDGGSTRTLPGIELPTLHSFRLVWSSVLLPKA